MTDAEIAYSKYLSSLKGGEMPMFFTTWYVHVWLKDNAGKTTKPD